MERYIPITIENKRIDNKTIASPNGKFVEKNDISANAVKNTAKPREYAFKTIVNNVKIVLIELVIYYVKINKKNKKQQ